MSDETTTSSVDELEVLKSRARMMGIEFSNNIKIDTLRARIDAKLEGETLAEENAEDADDDLAPRDNALTQGAESISVPAVPVAPIVAPIVAPVVAAPVSAVDEAPPAVVVVAPKKSFRQALIDDATRLVRLRITNLDPKKKDLHGEIICVANEFIGTIRKFVPFGEVTDEGFHVPHCIYEMLDARRFVDVRTTRDPKTGSPKVSTRWAREFALEILEPLTQEELNQLAQAQIAAGSIDSEQMA